MTIRDWVIEHIDNDTYEYQRIGTDGFVVFRPHRPDAYVFCPKPSDTLVFDRMDLVDAQEQVEGLQFVVLIRRVIANDTYHAADLMGICIANFPGLCAALDTERDVSRYLTEDLRFLCGRLRQNRHTSTLIRIGRFAFTVERTGGLRPLNVVFMEHYEVTSDAVYTLVANHPEMDVDAVVSTNPNCTGFAPDTKRAASDIGVAVMTLRTFLYSLGQTW